MRVISRKKLKEFWEQPEYQDAEQPLKSWYTEASKAEWNSPAEIKEQYRSASILKNNRVVFNIAGNKYRLVVMTSRDYTICLVRFVGTHQQYDKINAETI
ncbi:MAG: type II toxin-antitoxin system HigB family toxin [Alphaproteobacteria bacterium]|nr:type II toxin-antitoxin system HigB family toxin [Alphaproteobacteria bacterium]